ncbi:MAG: glutamate formimidoyltransferase [Burkholderiales bacterium]
MRKLVECVPNVSEGRDRAVIDAVAEAIRKTTGCTLLDVDPGASTNRTVYTFVGAPKAVVDGALAGARVARDRIDMRTQKGEHPRVGGLDVCPFVPVSGVTMDECVALANEFGRRAAEALGIPVFLYGHAARAEHRRTLQQIRAGEYEGLADKLSRPEWKPDYGPAAFVPEWGATCAGARDFLIAYNVNVFGTKEQAHRIALDVREAGRGPGQPGKLKAVRAIGWWVEEYGLAQVSINLEDYKTTPPHVAFEACREQARALGLAVAGSELVGLIPLQALLMAADHYIAREGLFILDEGQKVRLAVERLGLSSVSPFVPGKRIIEHMVPKGDDEPLASMSVRAFVEELGARSPAPGGGSASALVAAMGAALGAMVGWMTYGKRKFEAKDAAMRRLIPPLDEAMKALLPLVDKDTRAFDAYLAAVSLPKDTEQEKAARHAAMQAGLQAAVQVPLEVMRTADRCWEAMVEMAREGNFASRSDLEVGAKALEAGVWGASRNVAINLPGIEDAAFRSATGQESERLAARAQAMRDAVIQTLGSRSEAGSSGGAA